MGQARADQEQATQELRNLVDSIQNRRERELARLVKELKNAETELAKTRAPPGPEPEKNAGSPANPNAQERKRQLSRLAKEQAEIRKDLDRQLQKLAKLTAERAARAAKTPADQCSQAQGNLDEDNGDEAGKEQEEALATRGCRRMSSSRPAAKPKNSSPSNSSPEWATHSSRSPNARKKLSPKRPRTRPSDRKRKANSRSPSEPASRDLGEVQAGLKEETGELTENLDGCPSSP